MQNAKCKVQNKKCKVGVAIAIPNINIMPFYICFLSFSYFFFCKKQIAKLQIIYRIKLSIYRTINDTMHKAN